MLHIKSNDEPPVGEPPNAPRKPPIEDPGQPPKNPPQPENPPVKEPPDKPKKPPVKEPPSKHGSAGPKTINAPGRLSATLDRDYRHGISMQNNRFPGARYTITRMEQPVGLD